MSHSSEDIEVVQVVYDRLDKSITWLDRAEIEWGDLFLKKISEAMSKATDFLLFWSANAAKSSWVELEINMAFIRKMQEGAMNLRVVRLDDSPLPLHFMTFHFLDVYQIANPAERIVEAVYSLAKAPKTVLRHRFLNRGKELGPIEAAIDDPEVYLAFLAGFAGIGKESLAREAIRRFFQGGQVIHINVTEGTRLAELALYLNAHSREMNLDEGMTTEQMRNEICLSLEEIARTGRFLLLTNVQHWLDEDRFPMEPLTTVLDSLASIPGYKRIPCMMTSTRRLAPESSRVSGINTIWLDGLDDSVSSTLVRLWYHLNTGNELSDEQAGSVAKQVHGHPVAAKLAAALVAQFGADYLLEYQREFISLRRDLAKTLLLDMDLMDSTSSILKALAAAEVPLPPSTIVSALDENEEAFHRGVDQATSAGLLFHTDGRLGIHPLIAEHFWKLLHREDYSKLLGRLAKAVHRYSEKFEIGSPEFSLLLPVIFRLYASAGDWQTVQGLRSDLQGELERAAIFHYRRRNYDLAWDYVQHALNSAQPSWRIRLHQVRILIRRENWTDSDRVLDELLRERPRDRATLHLRGWSLLRQRRFKEALEVFVKVIAQRSHVASLRDAAECLHALENDEEALRFLARAKGVESDNPFVLDLEARILEEKGELDLAFKSAYIAMIRDPNNWAFHHRLGRIRVRQNRQGEALKHFRNAVELDRDQFTPLHSLASALLDTNQVTEAEGLLRQLKNKASTVNNRSLLSHLRARILIEQGDMDEGFVILEREIGRRRNLLPNLGVYADAKVREFDHKRVEYPATALLSLQQADDTVSRGLKIEANNQFLLETSQRIQSRRAKLSC